MRRVAEEDRADAISLLARLRGYPRKSALVGVRVTPNRPIPVPTDNPDPNPLVDELGWTKLATPAGPQGVGLPEAEPFGEWISENVGNLTGLEIAELLQIESRNVGQYPPPE